jgi:putative transposase
MTGLAIRADYEPAELRRLARRAKGRAQALRLLAIAVALEGAARAEAAKAGAMDRQTLRDGVIRFNEAGPEGLIDRPKGHARCRLPEGQLAVLKAWMLRGPNPKRDGVSAWRIVDAIAFCEERFGVHYSQEGMRRILRQELNLSHQKTRPVHPQHDPRRAEAFKKGAACPARHST